MGALKYLLYKLFHHLIGWFINKPFVVYYFFGPNGYSDIYMNEKWLK